MYKSIEMTMSLKNYICRHVLIFNQICRPQLQKNGKKCENLMILWVFEINVYSSPFSKAQNLGEICKSACGAETGNRRYGLR